MMATFYHSVTERERFDDYLEQGQDVMNAVNMAACRIDTPVEIDYFRNGRILHTVLRSILKGSR